MDRTANNMIRLGALSVWNVAYRRAGGGAEGVEAGAKAIADRFSLYPLLARAEVCAKAIKATRAAERIMRRIGKRNKRMEPIRDAPAKRKFGWEK